ncbi:MAG TPA: SDR family oxidoreductase [Candidatus Acidoferrales bacterium]|nr:SDR family oxidoreductase [Candidatus Acidoferrales bacterium]
MARENVVLITGCSAGFGRLMAETLARKNYFVFATMRGVAGHNKSAASELKSLAQRESLKLRVLELDVTDESSVTRAVDAVIAEAGRLDVVINNAGYTVSGLTEAFTIEQAQQIFDTNFFGAVRVNRAALPHMRRQCSGLLIHISSGAGRIAIPGAGFYCATKFALEAFAEAYRDELASLGIDSIIVEPGAYATSIFGKFELPEDAARAEAYGAANEIPRRVGEAVRKAAGNPQEVADAVVRLIETPAGSRPVRTRVAPVPSEAVDAYNKLSDQLHAVFNEWFGITDLVKFRPRAASAD